MVTRYATRYYFKKICYQIIWSHDMPLDIIPNDVSSDNVVTCYATRYYFKEMCHQIIWSHDMPLDITSK